MLNNKEHYDLMAAFDQSASPGLEKACRRYTEMMDKYYPSVKAERDEVLHSGIPSKQHIRWMLKQIPKLSPARAHRWLGFVQCALVHWGITSIDAEREATRGMFDEGDAKQETSHEQ